MGFICLKKGKRIFGSVPFGEMDFRLQDTGLGSKVNDLWPPTDHFIALF